MGSSGRASAGHTGGATGRSEGKAEPLDPRSLTTWSGEKRLGVICGTITNRGEVGADDEELFSQLWDRSVETAASLEGDFSLATYDGAENRFLVVTDKLGARPTYYTTEGPTRFSTSVESLVGSLSRPTVDEQAASDLLMMGHLWGNRTLVEEVKLLRPATILGVDVSSGEYSTERYWRPSYDTHSPGDAYMSEHVDRYYGAIRRVHRTLPDEVGLWLSGGLDSRTTAAAFTQTADASRLTSYVYDASPPTNDNPRIARKVAAELGIDLEEVPLTGDRFAAALDRAIAATDGMTPWNVSQNSSAIYNLESPPTCERPATGVTTSAAFAQFGSVNSIAPPCP